MFAVLENILIYLIYMDDIKFYEQLQKSERMIHILLQETEALFIKKFYNFSFRNDSNDWSKSENI
ncbi:hypothetical protein D3Z36_16260 [Lachnospiraceae bacterium]|nr:hypothetical protein [Lachnospiraceae bacterium]